jgi:hypothetical protein
MPRNFFCTHLPCNYIAEAIRIVGIRFQFPPQIHNLVPQISHPLPPSLQLSADSIDLKNRKTIKLAKLQKLPKMLRIARLLKFLWKYSKYYSLILTILGFVLSVHLFACVWIAEHSVCVLEIIKVSAIDADGQLAEDDAGIFPEICYETNHNVVYLEALFYTVCLMCGVSATAVTKQTGILLDSSTREATSSGMVFFVGTAIVCWGMAFAAHLFAHINIIVATRHKYMQVMTRFFLSLQVILSTCTVLYYYSASALSCDVVFIPGFSVHFSLRK